MPSLKSIPVVVGILGRGDKYPPPPPPPCTNATLDTPCTIGLIKTGFKHSEILSPVEFTLHSSVNF